MRSLSTVLCAGFMVVGLEAQFSTVNGPLLGFVPDGEGTAIRQAIGIPGASAMTGPLPLPVGVRDVRISPKQDYAFATQSENGQLVVINFGTGTVSAVGGEHPPTDILAISPTGTAAAGYAHKTKTVHVAGNLLDGPQIIYFFDISAIPGTATSMALADSGDTALVRFVDGDTVTLWLVGAWGQPWPMSTDSPSAVAFFPNTTDAVIAEDATQSLTIIRDLNVTAARIPLTLPENGIQSFGGVAVSDDGRQVFAGDRESGNIATIDLETGVGSLTSCGCPIAGFNRLNGRSTFRLTDASGGPIHVLDASTGEPRVVVIAPAFQVEEAQ